MAALPPAHINAEPEKSILMPPEASTPGPPGARLNAPQSLRDLEQISGLKAGEVIRLLGPPDFRRAEPPAEIWQYRAIDCVLDVFLYGENGDETKAGGAGGEYRVAHVETRDRGLVKVAGAACFGNLLADRTRLLQSKL